MGGGKGGGSQTIGYRYYMSLQIGLCRGPIDEVVEIKVGDKRAWPQAEGDEEKNDMFGKLFPGMQWSKLTQTIIFLTGRGRDTPIVDDRVTKITAGNLFGGDKKEGGVSGSLTVCMGKPTQIYPPWVKSLIKGDVPDFRGVATMVFDGMICAMNPYPKKWAVRVRRCEKGWDGALWQPQLATIWLADGTIKSMNGAHILYEAATNRDWGRGLPRSRLHEASWAEAAQTLYNERFGLCLSYKRQTPLQEFVKTVLDHIGGGIYIDRRTGLLKLALTRSDYDPDDLPLYTYSTGLISVEPEVASREGAINEVIVEYTDPLQDSKRSVRVQNLASIQSLNSLNSTKTSYHGIPVNELAARVAQRDLKASTAGNKRFTIKLDRRAWDTVPGGLFRISAPDKGIENLIVRAGKVSDGTLTGGTIDVVAVLDVFGLAKSAFVSEQESSWSPPDPTPFVIDNRHVREATYDELVKSLSPADLATVSELSSTVVTVAARPSPTSLEYRILSRIGSEEFTVRSSDSWSPMITLAAPVGRYDTIATFSSIEDAGTAAVGQLMQMGNEIVRVDALEISNDGQTGTITISRGCIDTLPLTHAAGLKCYFLQRIVGNDAREYARGERADIKLITITSSSELDPSLAPIDSVVTSARQGKPYAPGALMFNGQPAFNNTAIIGDLNITWAHRDRKTQADQVVSHFGGNVGPEAGVTYTLRFYSGSNALLRTVSGVVASNYLLSTADTDITGSVRLELEAKRGSIVSFNKYSVPFTRSIS